jgi:hypothetical protein
MKFARIPVTICLAAVSIAAAGPTSVRGDSDQLKQKIAVINRHASLGPKQPVRTTVTEREVNAYLAFELADDLPTGVVDPRLTILGSDRVTAQAVVDLDQVRMKRNPTSLLDPIRYLRGSLAVKATGFIRARDGVGRFELEGADIEGIPIPKFLLQQIVGHYSRSSARPAGFSLDDPVALPAGIREIQVGRGIAVVVQ